MFMLTAASNLACDSELRSIPSESRLVSSGEALYDERNESRIAAKEKGLSEQAGLEALFQWPSRSGSVIQRDPAGIVLERALLNHSAEHRVNAIRYSGTGTAEAQHFSNLCDEFVLWSFVL